MRVIICTGLLFVLLAFSSCNKSNTEPPAVNQASKPSPVSTADNDSASESKHTELAGSTLTLENGDEVMVYSVGDFDKDLNSLEGLIAVEGRIGEAYADRGAFVLVDCDRMAGCTDGCCPQAEVPVRLALENFEGRFPEAQSQVIVVGDLTVTDTGYNLAVREIREGEIVLLQAVAESV